MSDTLANMLCQITNAVHKYKETVELRSSKLNVEIAKVLKEEGFISHYKTSQDKVQPKIKMTLKYTPQKERVIQGIKRVSRPSLRVYKGWEEIPSVQNGLGTALVSTSKGVMTGENAKANKIGGEILAFIW